MSKQPKIKPIKDKDEIKAYSANKNSIAYEKKITPKARPIPKGRRNFILFFFSLNKRVIEKIKSSYMPKETAIVPPLTPGMIFEIPISMPLSTNHKISILRIHSFMFSINNFYIEGI